MTETTEAEEFIAVGQFGRVRGVIGEIYIRPLTDFPEQFKKGAAFWIETETGWMEIKLTASKSFTNGPAVKLKGIDTPEDAKKLTNSFLYIKKEALHKLPQDRFYFFDLVGCKVFDKNDKFYGKVIEVEENPANDLLVIEAKNGRKYLFPMIRKFVKKIDTEGKIIIIDPPGGIFDVSDED